MLTRDYLQCFKKGSSRISEMGGFIFKIRLAEVTNCVNYKISNYVVIALGIKLRMFLN